MLLSAGNIPYQNILTHSHPEEDRIPLLVVRFWNVHVISTPGGVSIYIYMHVICICIIVRPHKWAVNIMKMNQTLRWSWIIFHGHSMGCEWGFETCFLEYQWDNHWENRWKTKPRNHHLVNVFMIYLYYDIPSGKLT